MGDFSIDCGDDTGDFKSTVTLASWRGTARDFSGVCGLSMEFSAIIPNPGDTKGDGS